MAQEAEVLTPHFERRRLSDALVRTGSSLVRLGDALAAGPGGGQLPVGTGPGTVAAGDDARILAAQNAAQVTSLANGAAASAVSAEATARGAADAALATALGGKVAASGGDASATLATASGTTTARSLAARFADRLDALDLGVVADGATSAGAALTALGTAAAAASRDVWLPAGSYLVNAAAPWLLAPGVTYHLDRRAVIQCRGATTDGNGNCVHNNGVAGHYRVEGGVFRGALDATPTPGASNLFVYGADSCTFSDVRSEYSRGFGMSIHDCGRGTVRGCSVYRSRGDGIAVWRTPNALVTECDLEGCVDDAISAQCWDSDANPRAVVLITDNRIRESQGITARGAKMTTISDNILRQCLGNGVLVTTSPGSSEGDTPHFGVKVTGNQVFDQMSWPNPTPRNTGATGIAVLVQPRQAGGGTAAPGDPTPSTGAPVALLGAANGPGILYNQAPSGPQPGSYWLDISGNIIARSRPAVAAWAQWGGSASLYTGDNASGQTYAGAVTDANLQPVGIVLGGTIRNSRIADNIIRTGAAYGIQFMGTPASGDYDGLDIAGNQFSDFTSAGIQWPGAAATSHQLRVRANTFNGDPGFRSTNRATGGKWTADVPPSGVYGPTLAGVAYEGNHFRNLVRPVNAPANVLALGNVTFGQATAFGGFDPTSAGVGAVPVQGPGWQHVSEDADPRSATYAQILAAPSTVLPVSGGGTGAATAALARVALNRGIVDLVSAATVATDASLGCAFRLLLDQNATLATPTNMQAGASYAWRLRQDGTGGRTLAFPASYRFPGGVAPTLSTAAGATDVLTAISFDGTSLCAQLNKDIR